MDFLKVLFIVLAIVLGIVFICARVSYLRDEGYDDEMLWLHFFHGVPKRVIDRLDYERYIPSEGFAGKKADAQNAVDYDSYPSYYGCNFDPAVAEAMKVPAADEEHNNQILEAGGWKCACGKVHAHYVSSCSCGRNKSGETKPVPIRQEEATEDAAIAAIREYKMLLDEGILTAEEFEAKKKQLLGI